ncbi:MAG: ECF-type sigma factor [Thermoguttaceae bacterium]
MDDSVEITQYLGRLAQGDDQAAQVLWDKYFPELARQARRKLECIPRRAVDEEDIALDVLKSFCRGAAAGRFAGLGNRTDLWRLLLTILARKVIRVRRNHFSLKAGGGRIRGESAWLHAGATESEEGIARVPADGLPPDLEVAVAETCRDLLAMLPSDNARQIALHRMEGYTNPEIAEKLGCSLSNVERKLRNIRTAWEKSCPCE